MPGSLHIVRIHFDRLEPLSLELHARLTVNGAMVMKVKILARTTVLTGPAML
jgi:hypothetical protein